MPTWRDPRVAVAGILFSYVALGITVLGFNRTPAQIAVTAAAAISLDMVLHRLLRRGAAPLFPFSALITALSLSILANYAHGLWLGLVPAMLAISSKYLFVYQGNHVYNPALFGVVASLLLGDGLISESPAYQWGGNFAVLAFVITLALLLFVLPVRRNALIITFLLCYIVALTVRAWLMRWHMPMETWFMGALTSPAFFLFAFFMITDPRTSPRSTRGQILMAIGIVTIDFALHFRQMLSTLFFAAFGCATLRLIWLHGGSLLNACASGAGAVRNILATFAKYAAAILAVGVGVGFGLPQLMAHRLSELPDFTLVEIEAERTGIRARAGDVLENVDSRVAHIAKWVLSVGDAVAVADVDNDGLPDLFFSLPLKDRRDRAALYRNLGGFRFERIPLPALDDLVNDERTNGLPSGAMFLDFDNDGDQDLLVLVGYGRPRLLRNMMVEEGRLRFEDVTHAHELPEHAVALAANALDIDRDGRLDLVIGSAINPWLGDYSPPRRLNVFDLPRPEYEGDRRMFNFMHRTWHDARNGGGVYLAMQRSGRFVEAADLLADVDRGRWTLAIGAGDLDGDGYTDLYLANDFGPDQLLMNRNGKRFEPVRGRVAGAVGRDTFKGMNASLADFDGNGFLDIYVSNVHARLQAEGSLLWMNSGAAGAGAFRDQAMHRNALNERRFGWGAAVGDLDRDGRIDILQANGMVDNALDPLYAGCPDYWYWNDKIALTAPAVHGHADRWADLRGRCIFPDEKNRVYLNRGRYFVDVADVVGWAKGGTSRAIALVDLDNDGDLDVVVTRQFAPPSIYRNDSKPKAWLGIVLEGDGKRCNRDAVGTRVIAESHGPDGRRTQLRELHNVNGFSAQSDRRMLFGFGSLVDTVDVRVSWCGAREQQTVRLEPGRYHRLRQP
jgi:Na+-translocating ferredoxin:NAD+ oxidoreductase RnfD subunit